MNLSDGDAVNIDFNNSLEWVDENEWSTVRQNIAPLIGGTIVVSENVVTAGRPITLVGGPNVWVTKAKYDELRTQMNVINKSYTLTLADGSEHNVMFNRANGAPVQGAPIFRQNVPAADAKYTLTLRFVEI